MGHVCGNGDSSYYVHDDKSVWANSLMRDRLDPETLEVIERVEAKVVEGVVEAKVVKVKGTTLPVLTVPTKPAIDPAVSAENRERFKNLKTSEGDAAKRLLGGEGFNHSSFTRALYKGKDTPANKKKCREKYFAILKELKDNDLVRTQASDHFYKE